MGGICATEDRIPNLREDLDVPVVIGTAALAALMMQGASESELARLIEQSHNHSVAKLYDRSILRQFVFDRHRALALQNLAIAGSPVMRIGRSRLGFPSLRVLALVSPGDMQVNLPLDFITGHIDVQLDLLFLVPGRPLPDVVPDHDLLFFAASEPDAATFRRMVRLFDTWPRPVVNDPRLLPSLARDKLPAALAGYSGICSPASARIDHQTLIQLARGVHDLADLLPDSAYPILARPEGSHAGIGLQKIEKARDLACYAEENRAPNHFITAFIDYRDPDGFYRKSRIALIEGEPFLCHRAISSDWMIHYLNAGMDQCAAKRAEEAAAMAEFDDSFAARHREALAELYSLLRFDYFSIDCSETPDGRLLVFEADTVAIVHMLDSAALFPYKHVQMRRVFDAFEAMLHRRSLCRAGCPQERERRPVTPFPLQFCH